MGTPSIWNYSLHRFDQKYLFLSNNYKQITLIELKVTDKVNIP